MMVRCGVVVVAVIVIIIVVNSDDGARRSRLVLKLRSLISARWRRYA